MSSSFSFLSISSLSAIFSHHIQHTFPYYIHENETKRNDTVLDPFKFHISMFSSSIVTFTFFFFFIFTYHIVLYPPHHHKFRSPHLPRPLLALLYIASLHVFV